MFKVLNFIFTLFLIQCNQTLLIESEPSEAIIFNFENMTLMGRTPLVLNLKDINSKKVLIRKDGFENTVVKIDLNNFPFSRSKINFTLNPKKNVYLSTNPSHLDISLDGKIIGKTPLLTFLPTGEHKLFINESEETGFFIKANITDERMLWQREFDLQTKEVLYEEKFFYVEADVCKPTGAIKIALQSCIQGDCLNGCGTWVYDSPENTRTGIWKDGKSNGLSAEKWKGNDLLVGNFSDNIRQGKGTYYFRNTSSRKPFLIGGIYSGNWINNTISGKGMFQYKNGERITGIFDNYECLNCEKPLSLE